MGDLGGGIDRQVLAVERSPRRSASLQHDRLQRVVLLCGNFAELVSRYVPFTPLRLLWPSPANVQRHNGLAVVNNADIVLIAFARRSWR